MNIKKYYLSMALIAIWLYFIIVVTVGNIFLSNNWNAICQGLQLINVCVVMYLSIRIYKVMLNTDRNLFILFLLSTLFFAIAAIFYFITHYILNFPDPRNWNNLPCLVSSALWLSINLVYWWLLLFYNFELKHNGFILVIILLINLCLAYMLSKLNIELIFNLSEYFGIFQLYTNIVSFFVFNFTLYILICAKNIGMKLLAAGTISIVVVTILAYIVGDNPRNEFWFFSSTLLISGLVCIIADKTNRQFGIFSKGRSIKSILSAWALGVVLLTSSTLLVLGDYFNILTPAIVAYIPYLIFLYVIFAVLAALLISYIFETSIGQLNDTLRNFIKNSQNMEITPSKINIAELSMLNQVLVHSMKIITDNKIKDNLNKVAAKVVHDIQSPLSSLKTIVQFTTNMAEKERISVREAITSISDITNHMLSMYNNPSAIDEQPQSLLVSASLLQILSDKRYEYKNLDIKFESNFKLDANFAFIQVEPSHFKRMISNLLNNAVDALENKVDGKVSVRLNQNNEWVIIAVSDNGKGMLAETVDKIKNNTPVTTYKGGHGIGLDQVHDTLQRNLGKFDIYSTINSGTRIILKFPKILVPDWVQEEIKLIKDDIIVILDDDPSIHGAWEARLKAVLETLPSIQIKHFTSGLDTIDFINGLSQTEQQNVCLLTDYELLKQDLTGIDVINQTGIKCSTLVTSHYANHEVRELASKARIKILPKELVFAISLVLDKKIEPGSKKVETLNN